MPADGDLAALVRRHRRPEPSFVRAVAKALGDARTVHEVRPGPVSYVPADRRVLNDTDADGGADATLLTFPTVDTLAALALPAGGRVVVLARDPDRLRAGWLAEYASEVVAAEAGTLPTVDALASLVGPSAEVLHLPVPFTCVDGFGEGYYARPERLLDADVRAADAAWRLVDDLTARRSVAALRNALASGEWDARYGVLRRQPTLDGSVVLLRSVP
ncbi:SAM-dependent methyltransferase [Curtobacterium sp. SGAir0471]|uniref:SAM-dependent methyltransferase n=1 Tax=Curtobacterium sp. SGAir0471 TaxID=2070337 RepID=UPI0010CD1E69|nr:SAM-dependent methyltransferase [Curtobacterium sp. SGAir0471]QCR45292.1 SAM-dependent methyltransferase [Curtobacterium sp. SGAir0471]